MSSNLTIATPTLLDMRADPVKFPRLNTLDRLRATAEMTDIISRAYMYRGMSTDPTNVSFVASNLVEELLQDRIYGAGNISMAEIREVVKKAILETDIFISVSTLYKVIIEYCKGEGKQLEQTIRQRRTALPPSPVQVMMDVQAAEMAKAHRIK